MADRIHPSHSPSTSCDALIKPSGVSSNPKPPPGTYIVELPKDQVYRYPPPDAHKFQDYVNKRRSRRCFCCRCLCWTIGFLAIFLVLLAVTAGVLYLVFRPEFPKYSLLNVAIRGFNLTSSSSISPAFDVTIRAENPNDKIGIYHEKGSVVDVYYSGFHLVNGALAEIYLPSNKVTVFNTTLNSSGIVLTSAIKSELHTDSKKGSVPLVLNIRAPVKIKVGGLKTWKITVKVNCNVIVNNLSQNSKMISNDCKYSVKLW